MTAGDKPMTDSKSAVDRELLRRFVEFSAWVTAFSTVDLWGTGQAAAYLDTVIEQVGEAALRNLLESCSLPDDQPEPAAFGSEELIAVAGSIVKLWYVGVWYQPEQTPARPDVPGQRSPEQMGMPEARRQPPFVVSPAAYTEGLLWRAIGAHPAGAKAPGYGSWAVEPTFEDYAQGEIA